jgi:hypothetical protein
LVLCFLVVAGAVVDFEEEVLGEDELPDLPPHPATTRVLARIASSVSMAVGGVLLMGLAPVVA